MSVREFFFSPSFPRGGSGLTDAALAVKEQAEPPSKSSSNATAAPMPETTGWTSKTSREDVSHQIISSHFIGPQAENLLYFKQNIDIILEELRRARNNYYPEDGVCDPESS
jgi:hypothetical protein